MTLWQVTQGVNIAGLPTSTDDARAMCVAAVWNKGGWITFQSILGSLLSVILGGLVLPVTGKGELRKLLGESLTRLGSHWERVRDSAAEESSHSAHMGLYEGDYGTANLDQGNHPPGNDNYNSNDDGNNKPNATNAAAAAAGGRRSLVVSREQWDMLEMKMDEADEDGSVDDDDYSHDNSRRDAGERQREEKGLGVATSPQDQHDASSVDVCINVGAATAKTGAPSAPAATSTTAATAPKKATARPSTAKHLELQRQETAAIRKYMNFKQSRISLRQSENELIYLLRFVGPSLLRAVQLEPLDFKPDMSEAQVRSNLEHPFISISCQLSP